MSIEGATEEEIVRCYREHPWIYGYDEEEMRQEVLF
jgi:hypothetical protein